MGVETKRAVVIIPSYGVERRKVIPGVHEIRLSPMTTEAIRCATGMMQQYGIPNVIISCNLWDGDRHKEEGRQILMEMGTYGVNEDQITFLSPPPDNAYREATRFVNVARRLRAEDICIIADKWHRKYLETIFNYLWPQRVTIHTFTTPRYRRNLQGTWFRGICASNALTWATWNLFWNNLPASLVLPRGARKVSRTA